VPEANTHTLETAAAAARPPWLGDEVWPTRGVDANEMGNRSFHSAERVRSAPHGGGVESGRGG
jgi:hypothetical protein